GEQARQLAAVGIPAQVEPVVTQIEAGFPDAGHLLEASLDEPATGRTADALYQQLDLLLVTITAYIALLHLAAVKQFEFVLQSPGQGFGVDRMLGAVAVVGFQPPADDGLGDRFATGAAHGTGCAEYAYLPGRAGRNRLTTVVAGQRLAHGLSGNPDGVADPFPESLRRSASSRPRPAGRGRSGRYSDGPEW